MSDIDNEFFGDNRCFDKDLMSRVEFLKQSFTKAFGGDSNPVFAELREFCHLEPYGYVDKDGRVDNSKLAIMAGRVEVFKHIEYMLMAPTASIYERIQHGRM